MKLIGLLFALGSIALGANKLSSAPTKIQIMNPGTAGKIGQLAAQMSAGEWRILNETGDGSGMDYKNLLIACGPPGGPCQTSGDNILNWASKALWNPVAKEIHFIGKGASNQEQKHITYLELSNRWKIEAKPYWDCTPSENCFGHGYEQSSIDPVAGHVFYRQYYSDQVYRLNLSTKVWSQLPSAPNPSCCVAVEWFPEMNGLLLLGKGQLHIFEASRNAWRSLASGLPMGEYITMATYNPLKKVVVFGGGSDNPRALHKITATGAITRIADPPADVRVGDPSIIFTVDPRSGKYLLFTSSEDGNRLYEYNVDTNIWTQKTFSPPSTFSGLNDRVAVPIGNYGVIVFIVTGFSDSSSKALVYKHSN